MIHIKRGPRQANAYFAKPQKARKYEGRYKGRFVADEECEREEAIAHFTNQANFKTDEKGEKKLKNDFAFKVYKSSGIVRQLKEMFNGKCAYCEWKVGVEADVEIEHFRPKKGFFNEKTNRLEVPGYYWLAGTWSNLFLSCQHCNQQRTHEIPGEGKSTVGKQSHFPLREETRRIRHHTQKVADEEPFRMLLNPCVDSPAKYLEFVTVEKEDADEELGWVIERQRPAPGGRGPDGDQSIRVFGLQRPMLVEERAKHTTLLRLRLRELIEAGAQLRAARRDGSPGWQRSADKNFRAAGGRLREYLGPKAIFLGVTRQLLREYDELGRFDELKAMKLDPMDMVRASVAETEGIQRLPAADQVVAEAMGVTPELLPLMPDLFTDLTALGGRPQEVVELLRKHADLSPEVTAVDLGCGKGAVAVALASELGAWVLGVDLFEPFLDAAVSAAAEAGVKYMVSFRCGDLRETCAGTEVFDIAVLSAVGAGLFGGYADCVAALRRCVHPGGYLVIRDGVLNETRPNDATPDGYSHYRLYDEAATQLVTHGDDLIAKIVITPDQLQEQNSDDLQRLRAAADRLAAANPERREQLEAFLASQEREVAFIERETREALWLLRRGEER